MTSACPFTSAVDPAHRADPYPFYAAMPAGPTRLDDGRYVVRGYDAVLSLLHDPRASSVPPGAGSDEGMGSTSSDGEAGGDGGHAQSLLHLDPPEHDRLRRIMMRQFGPPHRPRLVADLEGEIAERVHGLLDAMAGRAESEVVAEFAHALPLAMICRLMDIPPGDEERFAGWVDAIVRDKGTGGATPEAKAGVRNLGAYLVEIASRRRGGAGTDILSGLVNDDGPDGRLPERSVGVMATLLLIAGHETTVNLIANGVLTLVRHPAEAMLIRDDPARAALVVEELLRFEPPVQFISNRTALADIVVGGTVIPKDSRMVLVVAGANRDPARFPRPDAFDPERGGACHLGFGSGVHSCFGAPLARLEAQLALRIFFERVRNPRLLAEPPPYRPSPLLRGPSDLRVGFDGIDPR